MNNELADKFRIQLQRCCTEEHLILFTKGKIKCCICLTFLSFECNTCNVEVEQHAQLGLGAYLTLVCAKIRQLHPCYN
jgi:hypothetical protein